MGNAAGIEGAPPQRYSLLQPCFSSCNGPRGCAGACCEVEAVVTGTNWTYVGEGNGGYSKVQTYNYVGEGEGSFENEVVTTYYGWKVRRCCIGLLSIVFLVALLYLLLAVMLPFGKGLIQGNDGSNSNDATGANGTATVGTATFDPSLVLPYNCSSLDPWTQTQQDWCCAHFGKGCPSTSSQPGATFSYDCKTNQENGIKGWSGARKAWCCAHKRLGCQSTLPADQGIANGRIVAPTAKPTTTPQLGQPDCASGQAMHWASWGIPQRQWCCKVRKVGCSPPPPLATSLPYDCNRDFNNWQSKWSPERKQWCCQYARRGCKPAPPAGTPPLLPSPPAVATHPPRPSRAPPPQQRQPSSARPTPEPPPRTTPRASVPVPRPSQAPPAWAPVATVQATSRTSLPFDCLAGFANWKHGWSPPKKAWCCQRTNRGCETTQKPTPSSSQTYECESSSTSDRWSTDKRAWCCKHRSRGCQTTSTPIQFDCAAGFANRERGWSNHKKEWCCKQKHVGCPASKKLETAPAADTPAPARSRPQGAPAEEPPGHVHAAAESAAARAPPGPARAAARSAPTGPGRAPAKATRITTERTGRAAAAAEPGPAPAPARAEARARPGRPGASQEAADPAQRLLKGVSAS